MPLFYCFQTHWLYILSKMVIKAYNSFIKCLGIHPKKETRLYPCTKPIISKYQVFKISRDRKTILEYGAGLSWSHFELHHPQISISRLNQWNRTFLEHKKRFINDQRTGKTKSGTYATFCISENQLWTQVVTQTSFIIDYYTINRCPTAP